MATGEKKWSSSEQQTKRTSYEPLPAGVYTLKMKRSWEVRQSESEKSSQLRHVNGYFVVVVPGKEDSKKRQYHSFHLDLTPSGSDGVVMPNRGGQLTELSKAVGESVNCGIIQQKKRLKDGSYVTVDTLNPKQVCDYLNNLDGSEVKAKLKVEKDYKGEMQNVIEWFEEGEPSEADEDDNEEELDEDEESLDEDESDEEADEDEDEDSDEPEELEDIPAPKKSKVVQGPAKKGIGKPSKKK